MKKFIYIVLVVFSLNSCGEYQKALQSDDIEEKFRVGEELYEAGKYEKARNLLSQVIPKYRGKPEADKVNYIFTKSFYEDRKYAEAGFRMEQFVSIFPQSEKADEIAFLGAKSYYHLSPVYSKEQKETIEAIAKLQSFINSFPESQYVAEANELVKELDFKLERKAFEIAKQYNFIGRQADDHVAAITTLNNFLLNYPGSSFIEDALFVRFDSSYKLAINSVQRRKKIRINDAIEHYKALKKAFSESKYIEQANIMHKELLDALKEFETQTTTSK